MVMTVEQRVAKGAEWLDSERPGWELEIDVATLDLSNTCLCVLGQVYSAAALSCQCQAHKLEYMCNFNGQAAGFNWVHNHMNHGPQWMWEHGFDDLHTFTQLQPAWLSLIKERLNNGITLEGE